MVLPKAIIIVHPVVFMCAVGIIATLVVITNHIIYTYYH